MLDASADKPSLDRIRLRFADEQTESRFNDHQLIENIWFLRASLLTGIAIWVVFGLVDVFAASDPRALWGIRYGAVLPLMITVFVLSYTEMFRRWGQRLIGLLVLATGVGIVGMEVVLEPPWPWRYYPGQIALLTFSAAMFRLHPRIMIPVSLGVLAIQETWALWSGMPVSHLVVQSAFLVLGLLVASHVSYAMELYVRQRFARDIAIERAMARESETRQRAEAADAAKGKFFTVLSHRLRTALTAIIGFAEVLEQSAGGRDGPEANYAARIRENGQHLFDLVTKILDMLRAEAGALRLAEDEFELGSISRLSVSPHRPRAEAKGIVLTAPESSEAMAIRGDPKLFKKALSNLVENAVKFTDEGSVEVRIKTGDEGGASVEVADTGPGLSEDDRETIFTPFQWAGDIRTDSSEGAGIGLPLAQRIAWLHGADIRVETSGEGSVFALDIPADRVLQAA